MHFYFKRSSSDEAGCLFGAFAAKIEREMISAQSEMAGHVRKISPARSWSYRSEKHLHSVAISE